MNIELFINSIKEFEKEKGIPAELVVVALEEAFKRAYITELKGGNDADVRVKIDIENQTISIQYVKKIVEEVEDDYLEISLEEALEINPKAKYKIGDEFIIDVNVDKLEKNTIKNVGNNFIQKIKEQERYMLYEAYKNKTQEMIVGTVESSNDKGVSISLGKNKVFLSRSEMIGDETFVPGSLIRVYLADATTTEKGPQIQISRAHPGYMRRVFEEEVRDIYDGTIIIKALAREAGKRCKVAVYTTNPNVDCVGACIGPGGSFIQKIIAQLGNSREKEKIDIIPYSSNEGLFIVEALRPASVTHIALDFENKKALAIVPDGTMSLAIGKKGSNARVAHKLTGWDIDIDEEHNRLDYVDQVHFYTIEELQEEEEKRQKEDKYQKYLEQQLRIQKEIDTLSTESGVNKGKPSKILDEELEEEVPVVSKVEELVKEETPVIEEVIKEPEMVVSEEVSKAKEVKTTTTLESLEKELESEKKKGDFKAGNKSRRPRKITEDEVSRDEEEIVVDKKDIKKMDIYSEAELAELENEVDDFEDDFEDDIDYDDFDKYYDND